MTQTNGSPSPVIVGIGGPVQRQVVVKCYDYYMNGTLAGVLFLKEPVRQCSWWSATTMLRTDWHGSWISWDGCGFAANFDWAGHTTQKFVVIFHNHRGNDYRGREICVTFTGRWAFDDAVADYVCY